MQQTRMRSAAFNAAISTAPQNFQFDCLMTFITETSFHFLPQIRYKSQEGNFVYIP